MIIIFHVNVSYFAHVCLVCKTSELKLFNMELIYSSSFTTKVKKEQDSKQAQKEKN